MRIVTLSLLFGLFLVLFAASCKKDCSCGVPPSSNVTISFRGLEVGQRSYYLGLLGEKYFNSSTNDFVYTDDTLILSVVGKDSIGFKVTESVHYYGDVDNWMAPDKDSTYVYYLKVENDTLHIIPAGTKHVASRIFDYVLYNEGLPLALFSDQTINITGWKTDLGYCECRREGYDDQHQQFGVDYSMLNVLIENSPMALDGPGRTVVYSADAGLVRFSTYSWWTQSGYGWDLLP